MKGTIGTGCCGNMGGCFIEAPKKIDLEEFLRISRMGVWRIEVEEGNSPRFYADEMMDKLLGIAGGADGYSDASHERIPGDQTDSVAFR